MLTSICVNTFQRPDWLVKTLQSIAQYARQPYEIIVVDDASTNPDVRTVLEMFKQGFAKVGVPITVQYNEKNLGAARSVNAALALAKGDVLIHCEDDILVPHAGWNIKFAELLAKFPEVGQVLPTGSGRGEGIPREAYQEFSWGLGGLFAMSREVYEKVGGWAKLLHQVEPDMNLRVRMAGWKVVEIPGIPMLHLGEGDQDETFKKQAMIICGVHQMLMKWNRRFTGMWDYDSLWSMSWDDFPPNVNFRRQIAAWFASEAEKLSDKYRGLGACKDVPQYLGMVPEEVKKQHVELSKCRLNAVPEFFQYPGHWGKYELVKLIRPAGREREPELINLMKNNHIFSSINRLPKAIKDLAVRLNYNLSEEELNTIVKSVPKDYVWEVQEVYAD